MRAARPSSGSASLVTRPGPLQPLDQLSHRRLADPFLRGQRRKPNGPFTAHPVQRKRSGRAQIGAVTQKPRGQVHCLIEKLADAVAGVFIGRPLSHPVSISCDLYSGNRSRASAQHNSHFTGQAALSRHSPRGGMRASCGPVCSQRHNAAQGALPLDHRDGHRVSAWHESGCYTANPAAMPALCSVSTGG